MSLERHCLHAIAIHLQVVVGQVQHLDLDELIRQSFLGLETDRKHARQIRLRVGDLFF